MITHKKVKLEIDIRGRHGGIRVDSSESSIQYPIPKASMVEIIAENVNEIGLRVTYNVTGIKDLRNWETVKLWVNKKYYGSIISFY